MTARGIGGNPADFEIVEVEHRFAVPPATAPRGTGRVEPCLVSRPGGSSSAARDFATGVGLPRGGEIRDLGPRSGDRDLATAIWDRDLGQASNRRVRATCARLQFDACPSLRVPSSTTTPGSRIALMKACSSIRGVSRCAFDSITLRSNAMESINGLAGNGSAAQTVTANSAHHGNSERMVMVDIRWGVCRDYARRASAMSAGAPGRRRSPCVHRSRAPSKPCSQQPVTR